MSDSKVYPADFNKLESKPSGEVFVRVEEINKMIEYGAIQVDKDKLDKYKFDTRRLI